MVGIIGATRVLEARGGFVDLEWCGGAGGGEIGVRGDGAAGGGWGCPALAVGGWHLPSYLPTIIHD